jgi:hypothetical protein
MKRIVHEEQSQREIPASTGTCAVLRWWKDFVRKSWNRPRSPVQLKYGVYPALTELKENVMCLYACTQH